MSSWHLRYASRVVHIGGVIAYPTEAVFGLGCSPWDFSAVSQILSIKNRSIDKGLIVVAAQIEQLEPLVEFTNIPNIDDILDTWPGPVTWVLPAKKNVPEWLTGNQTSIAVRVSAHNQVRELCKTAGCLVSTSANPAGRPPATTALRVRSYFANQVDYVVPGQLGGHKDTTEIRDGLTGNIIRSVT